MTSEELKNLLKKLIDEKKTALLEELYVGEKTVIADYFIIVTVHTPLQVRMIDDYLTEKAPEHGADILHRDGEYHSGWVVLDFGGVMVQIFTEAQKDRYRLAHFWETKQ